MSLQKANFRVDKWVVLRYATKAIIYIYMCARIPYLICSSMVREFAHVARGHRIDPSWGEPIELFLVPASAMTGVTKAVACAILSVG